MGLKGGVKVFPKKSVVPKTNKNAYFRGVYGGVLGGVHRGVSEGVSEGVCGGLHLHPSPKRWLYRMFLMLFFMPRQEKSPTGMCRILGLSRPFSTPMGG